DLGGVPAAGGRGVVRRRSGEATGSQGGGGVQGEGASPGHAARRGCTAGGRRIMTQPCPPRSQLERLIAQQLDPAEDGALTRHVEECPSCQALLDELSGSNPVTKQSVPNSTDGRSTALSEPGSSPSVQSVVDAAEGVIRRLKVRPPEARRPRRSEHTE